MMSPDAWHTNALRLYCGSQYRRNLAPYDAIEFYVKALSSEVGSSTFRIYKWDQSSRTVNMADYTQGGVLDGQWRHVFIPLDDLRTDEWTLGGASTLAWGGISSSSCAFGNRGSYGNCQHFLVDDVRVLDLTPPFVANYSLQSDTVLRLVINEPYDHRAAKVLSQYQIVSPSDPAYTSPQPAVDVGTFVHFEGFLPGGFSPDNVYEIFVRFNASFRNGHDYVLHVEGMIDESNNQMRPHELPFSFDDRTQRTSHIKLASALGFLPEASKHAYVGGYAPDLGGWVWAVGRNGTILGWDLTSEGTWRAWDSPTSRTLRAVAAIREDFALAVGDGGTILEFSGGAWRDASAPGLTHDLLAVAFGRTGVAWAVGRHGTTARLAVGAEEWEVVNSGSQHHLRGVWVGPPRTGHEVVPRTEGDIVEGLDYHNGLDVAYAVGDHGTLLLWNPIDASWRRIDHALTTADLHVIGENAVMGSGGDCLGFYWRMWQKVYSPRLQAEMGTARAVWSSYDNSHWAGGDGGIFRGKRWAAFSASQERATAAYKDPWELSHKPSGVVTGIAEVSTRFCGYSPNRRGCVDVVAVTDAGEVLKYDSRADSWSAFAMGDVPQHVASRGLLGLAAVPASVLRLPWPPPNATVRDVTDGGAAQAVFTAPLRMVAANWRLAGEDVLRLDFSEVRRAGHYVVHVPGLGISDTFVISDAALDFGAYTTARGLFYQRSGLPGGLQAPQASPRHARPEDTVGAVFSVDLLNSPLYNGEVTDGVTTVDAHGGWHDAGDYGRYMVTAAEALKDLVDGFDIDPTKWTSDDWNLPESGNGIPDLLDEMQWELEWMLRMQDSDGGVYHKLTSCNWFFGMPHEEMTPRLINPKSTHDTAFFAAAVAASSRVFAALHPNTTVSQRYLAAAADAWEFLMRHPGNELGEGVPAGGYGNPPGCHTGAYQDHYDYDNRLWAAAELYRATGERRYAAFIEAWYHGAGPRQLSSDSGAGRSRVAVAIDAYAEAGADGRDVDAAIVRANRKTFLRRAKVVLRLSQAQPFSTGDRIGVAGWIGWGKFTYGSRVVITLLKAWKLTGEQAYHDAAHLAIGPQYGANPLSMSFVTGLGERYPRNPTCEVCLADDVKDPYPGIPVFGVFAHLSNGHPFYTIANHDANNFPYIMYSSEDRPVLTRFIDHKQIIPQAEFTISTMSHTLVAVGLLAKRRNRLRVQNATLVLDDGSTWGSVRLGLAQPYTLPTASCTWIFEETSLNTLGVGASCGSGEGGEGGGEGGVLQLRVQLGSGASVTAGVTLTTRGPEVGYVNYETKQWQQSVVVVGAPSQGRRLMRTHEVDSGKVVAGPGGATSDADRPRGLDRALLTSRRRAQTSAQTVEADDAARSFVAVIGTEQAYDSGLMLMTNTSAPESPVSPYGAAGFDALALVESQSATGTQVDFDRGGPPEGGLFECPADCSGNGACLEDIGECMCLQGSSGDSCEIGAPLTGEGQCPSSCERRCEYTCQVYNPASGVCVGAESNNCRCTTSAPPWCPA